MLKKFLPIIILVIVVVAVGCFYGGMVYGKSSNKGFRPNIAGMSQRGDRVGGAGAVGGFVSGQVFQQ